MWPFPARIIDDAVVAWQLHAYEWLLRQLAGYGPLADRPLLLPGRGHFVADGETGHALALRIFRQVRSYVGVRDVAIDLVQQPPRRASIITDRVALEHWQPEPLGTCLVNESGTWEISYDPDLLDDREALISTFAHELGHILVPPDDDLPVEPEEYECLIDLCVAFLGFGVFLSNTRLERVTDGNWSWWRGGGYLPINDRLIATALFVSLKGEAGDQAAARGFLRPHWRDSFNKALRQLKRFEPELARLRALDREIAAARRQGGAAALASHA